MGNLVLTLGFFENRGLSTWYGESEHEKYGFTNNRKKNLRVKSTGKG